MQHLDPSPARMLTYAPLDTIALMVRSMLNNTLVVWAPTTTSQVGQLF